MEINLEDPILKNIIMEFIYNDLKMHYFKVFDLEISIFTSSDVDILKSDFCVYRTTSRTEEKSRMSKFYELDTFTDIIRNYKLEKLL